MSSAASRPRPSEAEAQRLVEQVAAERFVWERLRPGQAEAAVELVRGRAALVVMPTGYGKSAVYQVAGPATPGPTVVVSPLIALQHDQVSALEQTGVRDAGSRGSRAPARPAPCATRSRSRRCAGAERSRLEMLRGYAETTSCRRRYLLVYFGEQLPEPCGRCDTCRDGSAAEHGAGVAPQDAPGGLVADARVRHRERGEAW